MVQKELFDGCALYRLDSGELSVCVTEYGAAVQDICYRGRHVALGYPTLEGYRQGKAFIGAIVGRVANRIGGGAVTVGGKRCELSRNERNNTLHGGVESWDRRFWQGEIRGDSLRMTLFSPDGDNGFPGSVTAAVTYSVAGSELRIDFEGESDAETFFAPTTHIYFNLKGAGSILDTEMQIDSDGWLELDEEQIPTGRVLPAEGAFDFSVPRPIAQDYDHCFVLKGERACTARAGGIRMTLTTDYPALQFYTGIWLTEPFGKNGGFAVEPEFHPDAPNKPEFPSPLLRAGERYHKYACFRFEEE